MARFSLSLSLSLGLLLSWLIPSVFAQGQQSLGSCAQYTNLDFEIGFFVSGDLPEFYVFEVVVFNTETGTTETYIADPDVPIDGSCHWIAYLGPPMSPDDVSMETDTRYELTFNLYQSEQDIKFGFPPLESYPYTYYQCAASGSAGDFYCPYGDVDSYPDLVIEYTGETGNEMRIVPIQIGSLMGALAGGDVDDFFSDSLWVMPYYAQEICDQLDCTLTTNRLRNIPFITPQIGPAYTLTAQSDFEVPAVWDWEWDAAEVPELRFPQGRRLIVEGELDVDGVTLTAADANDGWGGILVRNPVGANPSASFKDATIEGVTSPPLTTGGASVSAYDAYVSLVDTEVTGGAGFNLAGVRAAGPDALVHISSATVGGSDFSRISSHTGHGVVATNDAEVRVALGSLIERNDGSGVYASNGGRVVLDESFVLDNARYGLEAFDYGEIDFVDLGAPSLTSSTTRNVIAENDLGGVLARDRASVSAGSYSDLTGACTACENTISDHSTDIAPVDVKAETGSVVFAESNHWGLGIASESDLVLDESGGSVIEVTPILTAPPSATGRSAGVAEKGNSGWGTEATARSGLRAVFVEAREAAAEGDYVRAFVLLRDVIVTAEDAALRRLAYTEATRLLRRSQPPSVVGFLEGVASGETGGSQYRPWALRALVVAYAAAGRAADAEAAAVALAEGYGDGGHARYGTLARFRLRLAADDLAGAGAALAAAEAAWPEHPSVEEAGAVYALASGEGGAGARSGSDAARTGDPALAEGAASPSGEPTLAVYPNPTSGAASVALTLDAAADVRVTVYDVLGREVAVLHEGTLDGGRHALSFDAVGLPAGVYVVRVAGGGIAAMQQITVVR